MSLTAAFGSVRFRCWLWLAVAVCLAAVLLPADRGQVEASTLAAGSHDVAAAPVRLSTSASSTSPWVTSAGVFAPAPTLGSLVDELGIMYAQFQAGGRTMWLLLFLSIMGLAFTLERLFRLRRSAVAPPGLAAEADSLWKQERYDDLRARCAADGSSLARIIDFLVRHRRSDPAHVSTAVSEMGARELRPHFRRTYPLAVVATLAPLVGLFGTVIGMIGAFSKFRHLGEEGDPAVFAEDISLALVTTATGLAIAVPGLAFYHYFRSAANKLGDQLEAEVSDLVNEWLILKEQDDADQA